MRMRLLSVAVAAMATAATFADPGDAANPARQPGTAAYTVRDLGGIEDFPITSAYAVNNEGVVVGQGVDPATLQGRAVVYQGGTIGAVAEGEEKAGIANDVNDAGQIVGYTWDEESPRVAMLWQNGDAVEIDMLAGDRGQAHSINEKGQVVGASAYEPGDFDQHAFLWDDEGLEDLGTLPGGATSRALGINSDGLIVGSSAVEPPSEDGQAAQHAVLWQEGEAIDLGLIGGTFSEATDVNASGQIVGSSTTGDGQRPFGPGTHAVLWKDDETTDLGTLGVGEKSAAEAINTAGVVVGRSMVVAGEPSGQPGENHAFIWQNGEMTDLNDLIPEDTGWVLEYAYDVNDEGVIVGVGTLDGQSRAFILTPSEP